jgi:CheY-like chemotaxis protein/HPt (histidine-containing phosphotransfer) domain-containing protein
VIGSVPPALALLQRRGAIVPLLWPITASALHDAVALALDAARSQVGSARPASPSGSTRGLRVLLAEDNPVNQRVAIAVLERAGHHVVLVEDGRAAVAAARQGDIDIVLMDVQLPVMDGLTAVRLIREAERAGGGHVPIIALTAQAMRDERERGMAAGVDAYVAKPFQARALLAEMEAAVARARGRWQRTDGEVSVAPGAGRTGAPVFDRLMALDRMGGDAVLLGELIGIFMAGVSSRRGAIQTALASGDGQLLGSVAHALRGSLLTLAALPAAAAAWELEEAASVPGTPTAAMATALEVELERLVAELGPAG